MGCERIGHGEWVICETAAIMGQRSQSVNDPHGPGSCGTRGHGARRVRAERQRRTPNRRASRSWPTRLRPSPACTPARSSDRSHNRSVCTLAGEPEPLRTAVLALFAKAGTVINLRAHPGGHPRIGAVDVVPFVPLGDSPWPIARRLPRPRPPRSRRPFHLPVYLYEEAAPSPSRRHLEHIRRGGFEGLATKMAWPEWRPRLVPRLLTLPPAQPSSERAGS